LAGKHKQSSYSFIKEWYTRWDMPNELRDKHHNPKTLVISVMQIYYV